MMCGQLLPAAQQLASSGALAGPSAAHCLSNLAQLLTGCAPADSSSSQRQQQQQAHSSSLADGQAAKAFVDAAQQLLLASKRPEASRPTHVGQHDSRSIADVLLDGCWMLGTQQHLLPLLQTLQQHSQQGMVVWAGYCCHLLQDSASSKPGSGSQGLSSSVLNVLAFAPKVLPSLWDWLARTAGLPLEAPLQASRGLDIAGGWQHEPWLRSGHGTRVCAQHAGT